MTITKYRLDTEFEIVGMWTLRNQSLQEGIVGTLKYSKDEPVLELIDVFSKNNFGKDKLDYIIGFSKDGEIIIVRNALRLSWNIPS